MYKPSFLWYNVLVTNKNSISYIHLVTNNNSLLQTVFRGKGKKNKQSKF